MSLNEIADYIEDTFEPVFRIAFSVFVGLLMLAGTLFLAGIIGWFIITAVHP